MKQKLSNHTLRKILIPVTALLLVLGIGLGIAASIAAPVLDHFLGTGAVISGGAENDGNYYDVKYASAEEAREAAYKVSEKIADEGMILLKNNGVLPLAKNSTVTPFGYRYLEPCYGQVGSGSGKPVIDPVTPEAALSAYYTLNNSVADAMRTAQIVDTIEAEGTAAAAKTGGLGGNSVLHEYAPTVYENAANGLSDTTAIVFIGREGHEDMDYKYDGYADGTPHYLALTENEKAMLRAAKASSKQVVVVVMSSAVMELGPIMGGELEADAILWAGHPGERGLNALGRLLSGEVNPSGRTVDVIPADFTKDPSYQNFGEMYYDNAFLATGANRSFIEYEEGIYYGYRFYETAVVEDPAFVYGTLDGKGAIAEAGAVLYPFGYGLSYTTFAQQIVSQEEKDGKLIISVSVTNTGDVPGKDVVELYLTAPYTEYDRENGVEKSAVALLDFGKTALLDAGASETLTFTLDPEDFASYDASHDNGDGTFGAYLLEQGEYVISARADSHTVLDSFSYTVPDNIWYTNANPRSAEKEMQAVLNTDGTATDQPKNGDTFVAATNLFPEMTAYMREETTILTRADWNNTLPTTPENRTKSVSAEYVDQFGREQFDPETDPELGNRKGSKVYAEAAPFSAAENGLSLSELRGKDFNDPMWDSLLDEIDWTKKSKLVDALFAANYSTGAIDSIGLPATRHADGANGLKLETAMDATATYVWAPMMAATWNTDLLYELGEAIGQEALQNDIFGWYSPAFNLHRSPFCGRIFEYYSEDPILSGKIATAVVSGAADNGLQSYIKHFAMNDVETNRANYLHTWATEQTAREIYLKPFEMVIRNARMTVNYVDENGETVSKVMRGANAMMTAQNCFGTNICFGHYNLITGLVRIEWGFDGLITTDMYYAKGTNNIQDLTLRAGGDTYLITMSALSDKKSATSLNLLRSAVHHVAYSVVNSNVMQGIPMGGSKEYATSPWVYGLIAIEAVLGVLVIGGVAWMILRQKNETKHPEQYRK